MNKFKPDFQWNIVLQNEISDTAGFNPLYVQLYINNCTKYKDNTIVCKRNTRLLITVIGRFTLRLLLQYLLLIAFPRRHRSQCMVFLNV